MSLDAILFDEPASAPNREVSGVMRSRAVITHEMGFSRSG